MTVSYSVIDLRENYVLEAYLSSPHMYHQSKFSPLIICFWNVHVPPPPSPLTASDLPLDAAWFLVAEGGELRACVSNVGPSGGGLTCLPTYHSLMSIDKWVVTRTGCGRGEAAGEESGTARCVPILILSHRCRQGISKEVRGERARVWACACVCAHGNIYIKKSNSECKILIT